MGIIVHGPSHASNVRSAGMPRLIFAILTYFMSFCCWAGWERLDRDTISLNGDIDKSSYSEYMKVADGGYTSVMLNSKGGNPSIALKIAQDIAKRGEIDIRVGDACASACANYLAISNKGRFTAQCDSIVAWHGTLNLDDELSMWRRAGAPKSLLKEYTVWFREFNERERRFYRDSGVNYEILADSVSAVSKENIGSDEAYGVDRETGDVTFSTSAAAWIPSFSDLKRYGITVNSPCMNRTREETAKIIGNPDFKFASAPVAPSGEK